MQEIQGILFQENSREELLPEFQPDFPYIATRVTYADPVTPWHWHRPVELFYIESGTLEYTTPGGKWVFPAGSGGFVNSNVLHSTWIPPSQEDTVTLLHIFDPQLLAGSPDSRMAAKYILPLTTAPEVEMIPLFPEDPAQNAILQKLLAALKLNDRDWGYEFRLREVLSEIWLGLFSLARPAITSREDPAAGDRQIKAMMIYIHEHYSEPITVRQLADSVHISKRTCFRLFQETLHMAPGAYIRSYRLQKACALLAKTDSPITRIAYDCGLGSSSHFGKIFREALGCTPAQYRKMARS